MRLYIERFLLDPDQASIINSTLFEMKILSKNSTRFIHQSESGSTPKGQFHDNFTITYRPVMCPHRPCRVWVRPRPGRGGGCSPCPGTGTIAVLRG